MAFWISLGLPLGASGQDPSRDTIDPGTVEVNPKDGQEYVWIPGGSFQRGCVPGDEECDEDEKPRHPVTISAGFWMGKTEVTVEAYERFAEAAAEPMPEAPEFNPDWAHKNHPVVRVTWDQAQAYCEWAGGRLPTESEYEYAMRGGHEGLKYPWGHGVNHEDANYQGVQGSDRWEHTAPVASFPANSFGLHDLAGNVWEWVSDWYHARSYAYAPPNDPLGPARGFERVLRGGSWFNVPRVMRASGRFKYVPIAEDSSVGFRCVLDALP